MKKWMFAALFLAMLCALMTGAAAEGEYQYDVTSDTTCTITKYKGSEAVLNIPEEIDGYRVTELAGAAFEGNTDLISVVIPEGVTSIGGFSFCSNLTSISIPDSVKSIGSWTFLYCSSLKSVSIPEGVTSIEDYTFWNCSALTSVELPESIRSIGKSAFRQCSALTSIKIPGGVTSIGQEAFSWSNISAVTIPAGVTSIGESAFWMCSNLASVTIEGNLTSIGMKAFSECPKIKTLILPDSIEYIGDNALPGQALIKFGKSAVIEEYCKANYLKYECDGVTEEKFTNVDDKIAWVIKTYIKPEMSEYQKALTLYDWLCANVAYDYQWYNTGVTTNQYGVGGKGALLGGSAVCDGYAYAYMWLLEAVGIEAVRVTGKANYNGEGHAWNLAKINGEWYQFDATWDESGDGSQHDYFALTDEVMRETHTQHSHKSIVCDSYAANYFYRSGMLDKSLADLQQKILTSIEARVFSNTIQVVWKESYGGNALSTLAMIAQEKYDWPMNGAVTISSTNCLYLYDDECFAEFTFTFTPGRVPGDANTDGLVDADDVLLLQQYLAGWGVEINTGNADLNEDGKVNVEDLMLVLQ